MVAASNRAREAGMRREGRCHGHMVRRPAGMRNGHHAPSWADRPAPACRRRSGAVAQLRRSTSWRTPPAASTVQQRWRRCRTWDCSGFPDGCRNPLPRGARAGRLVTHIASSWPALPWRKPHRSRAMRAVAPAVQPPRLRPGPAHAPARAAPARADALERYDRTPARRTRAARWAVRPMAAAARPGDHDLSSLTSRNKETVRHVA